MPGIAPTAGDKVNKKYNIIISLKLISILQNSKDIMIPVGNRNYLVSNLTILGLNHLSTDYSTNYKAERYTMNSFFFLV